jgi:hypothetical protein
MECQLCGGPLGVLGILGNKVWLLCRDCGMQSSMDKVKFDEQQEVYQEEDA